MEALEVLGALKVLEQLETSRGIGGARDAGGVGGVVDVGCVEGVRGVSGVRGVGGARGVGGIGGVGGGGGVGVGGGGRAGGGDRALGRPPPRKTIFCRGDASDAQPRSNWNPGRVANTATRDASHACGMLRSASWPNTWPNVNRALRSARRWLVHAHSDTHTDSTHALGVSPFRNRRPGRCPTATIRAC